MPQLRRLFGANLWVADHPLQGSRVGRRVLRLVRISVLAWRSFWADECMLRATALAYTTILSIVPLLAVAFSLFAAFPGLRDSYSELKAIIYHYLAAGASEVVISALDRFINNVHSGAIASIGTGALFITVIFMLSAIENSFNRIWEVRIARRVFDRLVYYLAIVIMGPVFLGISLKTFVTAVLTEFSALHLAEQSEFAALWNIGVPLLASCAACTVLYVTIPNTKVYWSAGIAGGVVGGVLFELAKRAYTLYATRAIAYSAIYGAVGSIPIFLVWIYVIWLVVLFGAEFAYAWQNVEAHRRQRAHRDMTQSYREWLAVSFCVEAVRHFSTGKPGPTAISLRDMFDVPLQLTRELLNRLRSHGILAESDRGYLPARSPEHITLADIVTALRDGWKRENPSEKDRRSGDPTVSSALAELEHLTREAYGKITLAALVPQKEESPQPALSPARSDAPS